jgi:hypothetical protein
MLFDEIYVTTMWSIEYILKLYSQREHILLDIIYVIRWNICYNCVINRLYITRYIMCYSMEYMLQLCDR